MINDHDGDHEDDSNKYDAHENNYDANYDHKNDCHEDDSYDDYSEAWVLVPSYVPCTLRQVRGVYDAGNVQERS